MLTVEGGDYKKLHSHDEGTLIVGIGKWIWEAKEETAKRMTPRKKKNKIRKDTEELGIQHNAV